MVPKGIPIEDPSDSDESSVQGVSPEHVVALPRNMVLYKKSRSSPAFGQPPSSVKAPAAHVEEQKKSTHGAAATHPGRATSRLR